jgi:ABC-type transporter Mla maintaining outer membrane lipid asymmetry ATPase subunit MlaF
MSQPQPRPQPALKISIRELAVAVNKRLILKGVDLDVEANTIVSVMAHASSDTSAIINSTTSSSVACAPPSSGTK